MPDAGDLVTVRITVDPHDGTTAATLTVTAPDGGLSTPAATTVDNGATWTAQVTYGTAGVWRLSWTVAGTGALVNHQLVSVTPIPDVVAAGRTYATTTQLADELKKAPPLDAVQLLERASELLDADFLLTAIYEVDANGMPTDPDVAAAFMKAVCAQIEFWGEAGEEVDITGPLESVTIGSVAIKHAAGGGGPGYHAPKLIRALKNLPKEKIRFAVLGSC
ncbi:hypothetical protein ACFV0C_37070 [Streptomyces sp. NPDC059568]|uniref:hypothetical protein n=1 Tax=Streptomyces sp. NPDC059568 TaxID=3346868 RepID=UPI0036B00679